MVDFVLLAMGLTAAIGFILSLKNSSVLNGRKVASEVAVEGAGALADMSKVLSKIVEAQNDNTITAEELQGIWNEAKEVEKHAMAIKDKTLA